MLRTTLLLLMLLLPLGGANILDHATDGPAYMADGQFKLPEHYREWVFLTSGVDMSYDPKPQPAEHTMFDNVFVNPLAYKASSQRARGRRGQ